MRKSIKESDYILQFDEFLSLMKKEDVIVKVAKNGYVFFADDETLGNNLLGFINPNTSNQKLHIKVPVSTVASLDEFENTKELVDFIISEYSHYKRKFESKKSARKSIKESKSDLLVDIQNLISSSGLLDSIADVEDTLEIAYMIAERLDPSDYGFKDEDALANKINFELKYDREYAKLFESKKFVRKSIKESKGVDKLDVLSLCYYCAEDVDVEIYSYYNANDEVKLLDSFKRKNYLGSAYKYNQIESFEIDGNIMIIYLEQDTEIM